MKPPDYLNEEQKLVWMHGHIAGFNLAMDMKQNWFRDAEKIVTGEDRKYCLPCGSLLEEGFSQLISCLKCPKCGYSVTKDSYAAT